MKNYKEKSNYTAYILGGIGLAVLIFLAILLGNASTNETKNKTPKDSGSMTSLNNMVSQPMPDFTLKDKDGKTYSPQTLRGKNVILFFNEGLQCYPACWNQIAALGKDSRFMSEDTIALSVIPNSSQEWQRALSKMPDLNKATVLYDQDTSVSKKFGVLNVESSMHSGALPGHTYIVVDKTGVVRYFFDDPKMGIHNDELIENIKKLNK